MRTDWSRIGWLIGIEGSEIQYIEAIIVAKATEIQYFESDESFLELELVFISIENKDLNCNPFSIFQPFQMLLPISTIFCPFLYTNYCTNVWKPVLNCINRVQPNRWELVILVIAFSTFFETSTLVSQFHPFLTKN